MDKVLLVIPAYNEGKNIERVVDHIKNDFPELDYVVVNDGSKDDTADICRRRGYNFIDLPVNLGLAGCFQTGMKYAWQKGYNYAVQFDGDGQHRPEYIQAMKEKMDEGYDIVIGSRFVTEKKSWSNNNVITFIHFFFHGLNIFRSVLSVTVKLYSVAVALLPCIFHTGLETASQS